MDSPLLTFSIWDYTQNMEEILNHIAFKMILIKGGTFQMGDVMNDDEYSDEKPVHEVTLNSYYLGETPVTQELWSTVMGNNPSYFKNCDQCPVENVSWEDIVNDFLPRLNEMTGKTYRLPTEAEWEYAAREGGKQVRFGNGKNIADPKEINFDGRESYKQSYSVAGEYRRKTTPVRSFAPNALGLYDMSGNVWEWCSDWYGPYPSTPQANFKGPLSGYSRVFRGGNWLSYPRNMRVAYRNSNAPAGQGSYLGFRLCLSFDQMNPKGPATGSYRVNRGGGWFNGPLSTRVTDRDCNTLTTKGDGLGFRLALS